MKNLTMKAEYTFRFIHPKTKRKFRHRYQNLSLAGKLKWRADIRKTMASLQKTGMYRPDGSLDIFEVANRAQRNRQGGA